MHAAQKIPDSFESERTTIVVTAFLLIMSQTVFHLFHNQAQSCHFDRIPFDSKAIRTIDLMPSIQSCRDRFQILVSFFIFTSIDIASNQKGKEVH